MHPLPLVDAADGFPYDGPTRTSEFWEDTNVDSGPITPRREGRCGSCVKQRHDPEAPYLARFAIFATCGTAKGILLSRF